ncbi:MAG: hypothetical protein L6461_02735 [Anaerolineae bacterium]|nr:hypothetical protein [Anaerolineae bacterium]
MKLYRFVSYSSLAVILIAFLLLGSLPFRFPDAMIAWEPVVLLLSPAVVLVALLFVKPLLSSKGFLLLNLLLAAIAILLTIAGRMSPVLLGIFFLACFTLYLSKNIRRNRL